MGESLFCNIYQYKRLIQVLLATFVDAYIKAFEQLQLVMRERDSCHYGILVFSQYITTVFIIFQQYMFQFQKKKDFFFFQHVANHLIHLINISYISFTAHELTMINSRLMIRFDYLNVRFQYFFFTKHLDHPLYESIC